MSLKRCWPMLLIGIVLAGLCPQATWAKAGPHRTPVAGVYVRNDQGLLAARTEWAQGGAMQLGWRQVQPEAGVFDFSTLDNWIAQEARAGKRSVIGITFRCEDGQNGEDACAPLWALDWEPILAQGKPRLNYLDARVEEQIKLLVAALARHYAADNRLAYVQVGLGYSGENSPCPPSSANIADQAEQCAAYQAAYADRPDGWQRYGAEITRAYATSFEQSGGQYHIPLQMIMTGAYPDESARATLVKQALDLGLGLHDARLAASFLTGGQPAGRCAQEYATQEPMAVEPDVVDQGAGDDALSTDSAEAYAYQSHWVPLERRWRDGAVSFEFNRWMPSSEMALSSEESTWWGVLNALDKHASMILADGAVLGWKDAWNYFGRYAGKDERTTPDAWIALRGGSQAWCGDAEDYGWFMSHRTAAAGDSTLAYSASQPGGRAGQSWQGAFSRSTDIANGRPSVYLELDDRFMHGAGIALVEVTYWDGTPDMAGLTWELAYDGQGSPGQVAGSVTLGGSDRWLVYPFTVLDAAFMNRLPDAAGQPGSDLRLSATADGDVRFHMVRVQKLVEMPAAPQRPARARFAAVTASPAAARAGQVMTASLPLQTAEAAVIPATPTVEATAAVQATTAQGQTGGQPVPTPTATPVGRDIIRYRATAGQENVHDTTIDSSRPLENLSTDNTLIVRAESPAEALISFDLLDLPQDTQILAAWLEINVVGRSAPQALSLAGYPMLRAWDDKTASWARPQAQAAWGGAGPNEGADTWQSPAATAALPASGLFQLALTEVVQEWLAKPEQNHGLLLNAVGDIGIEYYLASSEWLAADRRPRLRIRVADGVNALQISEPVPTPSPVPTPTANRTATETASATLANPPSQRLAPDDGAGAIVYGPWPVTTPQPVEVVTRLGQSAAPDGGPKTLRAYLYGPDGQGLPCDWQPTVRLWAAAGQRPAEFAGLGAREVITQAGQAFPVWRFTGLDLDALRDGENLLHLYATVDGKRTAHDILTLGPGEGTQYPEPKAPEHGVSVKPTSLDASIEIVWPRNDAQIKDAGTANVTVALYRKGTREMIPAHLGVLPTLQLHWSINGGVDQAGSLPPVARWRLIQTPWFTYYLWDFTDVDVSAAREAGQYVNFWVEVPGMDYRTNVWAHGYGPHAAPAEPAPSASCH